MSVPAELVTPASRYEVPAWIDLTDEAERLRLSRSGLRGYRRLAARWGLSVEETVALLGGVPASTWHSWGRTSPADLGVDRLTRISLLLGIYTTLHAMHSGPLADEWVRRPNTNRLFGGRRPLDVMVEGGIPALTAVRALLDSRRGGS